MNHHRKTSATNSDEESHGKSVMMLCDSVKLRKRTTKVYKTHQKVVGETPKLGNIRKVRTRQRKEKIKRNLLAIFNDSNEPNDDDDNINYYSSRPRRKAAEIACQRISSIFKVGVIKGMSRKDSV